MKEEKEKLSKLIEEAVYTSPLSLLTITDPVLLEQIRNYLPYSTGFETECGTSPLFKINEFGLIPNIMDYSGGDGEQRFRIPAGITGLVCLYCISMLLKTRSTFNPDSGNHYHVDKTGYSINFTDKFIEKNSEWILKELDTWNYKGFYNNRAIGSAKGNWVNNRDYTIEYRCGEMAFDYTELVKCIISANSITRNLKLQVDSVKVEKDLKAVPLELQNKEKVISYLQSNPFNSNDNTTKILKFELDKLKEKYNSITKTEPLESTNDVRTIVNSRIEEI